MENIDGALAFQATLDIDDFNVSADAMERHIRKASSGIQSEAEAMEKSILDFAQKGAMYIQAYLVGQGMTGLMQSIVQVRGQFQQLEIAFGTMLGSETEATRLMNQMIQTAAKTPFDLMGVASGAKQLLAYGEAADRVNDTLVRLGNIASGLSIPLNDIVYLYGTTMVQGRLYAQDVRQFTGRGIPLVKELAKMYGVTAEEINNMVSAGKIGFADVEKVLRSMTDQGGQFYNLMEKQSASLTGMISNLEDSWDSMLNDIGKKNQDVFAAGISSASYLVEHYQQIIDILEAVALGYGTYKAAVVANTLATKGNTGIALIDNTVMQIKVALLKAEAVATGQVAAQNAKMVASQQAHVAALEQELTAEELANLKKKIRIATIQSLLTAQQAEYLSNIGLTTSSEGYEAAAMGVLNVDQQLAIRKLDLTGKNAAYRASLEQEVAAKQRSVIASKQKAASELDEMRVEVKAAASRVEAAKQSAISSLQSVEAARYELYWARVSGNQKAIATAQLKLETAEKNKALASSAALAAQSDFFAKKKALEAAAIATSKNASVADTQAKVAQGTATSVLTSITAKCTAAMSTLWATMKANPLGWIITIVGMATSAFMLFRKEEEENTDAMDEFQNTTQKEIRQLELLFAILQNSEKQTKTHRDAIDKVNAICKEYNKTLLDENATISQQKLKYEELRRAIQETTAEKIKAKYVEQASNDYSKESAANYSRFVEDLDSARYDTGRKRTVTNRSLGETVEVAETKVAESIRNMDNVVREAVQSSVDESASALARLSADSFTEEYDRVVADIMARTKAAIGASDAEMKSFESILRNYLDSQIKSVRAMDETVEEATKGLDAFFGKKDPKPVANATDLISMSFADLDSKLKSAQDRMAGYTELTRQNVSEMTKAGQQMLDLFKGGNVDLLARPLVDAAELVKKGWEDAGEGIATVYSMQQQVNDSKGKAHEILFTPILPDGTVLSHGELQDYISSTLDGADDILKADTKGVVIQVDADPDGKSGELLHNLQEIYYLCDKDASVNIDTGKLQEMTSTLGELLRINATIEAKTRSLNTENGLQDRIKELRELIATEEFGSEQRRKHIVELNRLERTLEENKATRKDDGDKDAEQLDEKRLEAQRKLERARIEIMEEGYAKRKATLDLQHQLALEQIDKEEKELEKARQKAGKGSKGMQTHESSNIRGAGADLWSEVEAKAKDGLHRLSDLTGQAYTETYNQVLESMVGAIRNATNASGAEIDAFRPRLKEYLDSYVKAASDASSEAGEMGNAMEAQSVYLDRLAEAASTATYQTYGLTEAERSLFQERRKLANQEYTIESTKLFDGEIEYKKQQYQAYFNWVRNVGQKEADAHFKTLIAEGSSFTAWINQQIADLEARKAAGTLTDGDANALNALRIQQDELNGTKTAMDLFRESVARTVGQAQTLAEKLQAIADLKERLASGEFHLNQDETAAASYELQQQDSDIQKEVQDKVLSDYRTYEEKRLSIMRDYQALREAAERNGNADRIRMINEAENEALSSLNADMLKHSDSWKRIFTDLDSLSSSELATLISDFQKQLQNADLKLNPVDYKALMDSLDQAKEVLISKNPFKAMNQFYDDYAKARKKLADAKARMAAGEGSEKDVRDAEGEVKKAAKGMTDTVEKLTRTATECGSAIASIFDSLGNEGLSDSLGTAVNMMGALGDAAASYGRMMSGDILGGISGMVSSVSSVIGIFSKLHDAKYERRIKQLQNDIDNLEASYTRLERAFNNTYWVFTDEQRDAYEKNIDLINEQIKALELEAETAKKSWRFSEYSKLTKEIKELQSALSDAQRQGDMFTIFQTQIANLREQQRLMEQQIENERKKKKTDNDKIKQWTNQIESASQQIEDLESQMMETLAGTSVKTAIDDFASALVDAYSRGEDGAEALGEKTKAVLKNAVVEALKRQFLAKGINDAVEYLSDAMKDSVLSDKERAHFTELVKQAGSLFNTALEGVGDWIKDIQDGESETEDALAGAVRGMSEETGGVIAGRINAFIINQGDQTAIMRQMLLHQAAISANTGNTVAELQQIKAELKALRNGGNALLTQGIS